MPIPKANLADIAMLDALMAKYINTFKAVAKSGRRARIPSRRRLLLHSPSPKPNLHLQRPLIPQDPALLLLPSPALSLRRLEIKSPQEVRENQPHLQVCQVATEAIARTQREGVESAQGTLGQAGRVRPTRRIKRDGRIGEIRRRAVRRVAGSGYENLFTGRHVRYGTRLYRFCEDSLLRQGAIAR